jgi:hypothetical protein
MIQKALQADVRGNIHHWNRATVIRYKEQNIESLVNRAYKTKMRTKGCHPNKVDQADETAVAEAHRRFLFITAARNTLLSPELRAQYVCFLFNRASTHAAGVSRSLTHAAGNVAQYHCHPPCTNALQY